MNLPLFDLPIQRTPEVHRARDEASWAWAAGLFEGEGCIRHSRGTSCRRLALNMTDLDVLQTFQAVVGAGSLRERKQNVPKHWKRSWAWNCSTWSEVERIGRRMLPYLHARRRAKMQELLADRPIRGSGLRRRGIHKLSDGNLYVKPNGDRKCRACARQGQRLRRQRSAA